MIHWLNPTLDCIYIGVCPKEERTTADSSKDEQDECDVYMNQLLRVLHEEGYGDYRHLPKAFSIQVKLRYGLGTYHNVAIVIDDALDSNDVDIAYELAYWLESNLPAYWDEFAKKELYL